MLAVAGKVIGADLAYHFGSPFDEIQDSYIPINIATLLLLMADVFCCCQILGATPTFPFANHNQCRSLIWLGLVWLHPKMRYSCAFASCRFAISATHLGLCVWTWIETVVVYKRPGITFGRKLAVGQIFRLEAADQPHCRCHYMVSAE
jgi:hypothetical protein